MFICFIWSFGLIASATEAGPSFLPANDPVQIETALIARARNAALCGDENGTDAELMTPGAERNIAPSVLLARRTMAVCGWLQNDNEFARAKKLAQRAIRRLASMQESNDGDRAERLYWEALLEGRILDRRKVALERLAAAKKLKPGDERVLALDGEFTAAMAQFGH